MPICTLPNNIQICSFYNKNDTPWYSLTNYSPDKVQIYDPLLKENILWKTTEHFFQAQKIIDKTTRMRFIDDMSSLGPNECRTRVNQYQPHDPNWHHMTKENVMLIALRSKYDQCSQIRTLLNPLHNIPIVEDTAGANYSDDFWGCGWNGTGQNKLGELWMQVLFEKRDGLTSQDASTKALQLQQQAREALALLGHRRGTLLQNTPNVQTTSVQNSFQNQSHQSAAGGNDFYTDPHSAINRVLRATDATSVSLRDDANRPGKKMVALKFAQPMNAQTFSAQHGNAPRAGNDTVLLGENRAPVVFQNLNIPIHGRRNPRPMLHALVYEINNRTSPNLHTNILPQPHHRAHHYMPYYLGKTVNSPTPSSQNARSFTSNQPQHITRHSFGKR